MKQEYAKYIDILKKYELKITMPRLKILSLLDYVNKEKGHFTAEELYQKLLNDETGVGVATVYRVLNHFYEIGLVERHNMDNKAIYELRTALHHDHLVCIKCNRIIEFHDDEIEQRQQVISQKYDFTLRHHSLYIYGICSEPKCRETI